MVAEGNTICGYKFLKSNSHDQHHQRCHSKANKCYEMVILKVEVKEKEKRASQKDLHLVRSVNHIHYARCGNVCDEDFIEKQKEEEGIRTKEASVFLSLLSPASVKEDKPRGFKHSESQREAILRYFCYPQGEDAFPNSEIIGKKKMKKSGAASKPKKKKREYTATKDSPDVRNTVAAIYVSMKANGIERTKRMKIFADAGFDYPERTLYRYVEKLEEGKSPVDVSKKGGRNKTLSVERTHFCWMDNFKKMRKMKQWI